MSLDPTVNRVTQRVRARSEPARAAYLARIEAAGLAGAARERVSCTNFAHAFAASPGLDKIAVRTRSAPHVAIVSAYNDMLSAHVPLAACPDIIRAAVREAGATAQFAGGVPAMCDGVTQGQPGMELSLWSRDVIAQATAIALAHGVFDAALLLGVCDKIVPGLLIGALAFGHLPAILVPAGPMSSGRANDEKARVRERYSLGLASREELLESEAQAYHGAGTCTFYGTANTNQLLMEVMGLHLPGSAFVPPDTQLREALTAQAARRVVALTREGGAYTPVGRLVDERTLVNAIVALLATGGSTNHTIHLIAIARAAGIALEWDDFDQLSRAVPLIARVYPSGKADVNHFHAAGGAAFVIRELLDAGLLHPDVATVSGDGLRAQAREPVLSGGVLRWRAAGRRSLDREVLRTVCEPFSREGGLRLLQGNLGRAVIKTSAVPAEWLSLAAPARVFEDPAGVISAFKAGELERDVVVVVRFQGPRANGMPELHQLTPCLTVLQDRGFKVALVTDGRMSGASGRIPAAIHLCPEAEGGGPVARLRDGDPVLLDAHAGELQARVDPLEWARREPASAGVDSAAGFGRELFASHRANARGAEDGAVSWEAACWKA